MKLNKIKEMSSPELEKELGELKTELFKLKFSLASHSLEYRYTSYKVLGIF